MGLSAQICGSCASLECLLYSGNLCNPGHGPHCCSDPEYSRCMAEFTVGVGVCARCAIKRDAKSCIACAKAMKNCRRDHCRIKPNCGCDAGESEHNF
jgi:hypothetical protein